MRTKALKLIVLFMALLPSFLQSNAANVIIDQGSGDGRPIAIRSTGTKPPRSIEPECYYQDGYVYIICGNGVTSISATVTRLSDNAQWSNSSLSNTLQIAVSTDAGTYSLDFTLSDGSSYYGEYIL